MYTFSGETSKAVSQPEDSIEIQVPKGKPLVASCTEDMHSMSLCLPRWCSIVPGMRLSIELGKVLRIYASELFPRSRPMHFWPISVVPASSGGCSCCASHCVTSRATSSYIKR